jgi:hypothetical protein
MAAKIIYLRTATRIGTPPLVKARQFRLAQQRGAKQMNLAAYNMAKSHYSATSDAFSNHITKCADCKAAEHPASERAGYCETGRAAYDEALSAQRELDQATRDALAGYCADCD